MAVKKTQANSNATSDNSPRFLATHFPTRRALLALLLALSLSAPTAFWLLRSRGAWGRDGWFLTPHAPWYLGAWWLPIGVLFIFGGLSAVSAYDRFRRAKTFKEQRASLRMSVGALMLMSLLWHWSLLGPSSGIEGVSSGAYNVLASQWSDISTQYLGAAYQTENAREFSRNYATQSQNPTAPAIAHVSTHPPGATLFYFACRRLVETIPSLENVLLNGVESAAGDNRAKLANEFNVIRVVGARSVGVSDRDAAALPLPISALATSALAAIFMVGALAASVPAVFILTRDCGAKAPASTCSEENRAADEARGLCAAALWVLAPTVGLFAPTLDALIACGAAWTLALCGKYLHATQSGNVPRKYLHSEITLCFAGALWAVTTYISFGALVVGAVVTVWFVWQKQPRALLWFYGAFAATWLLIWLLWPLDLPRVWSNAMAAHHLATLQTRSRTGWLWFNGPIFAVFCGWPVVASCACTLWRARDENYARALQLALSMLGVLTLISLAGSVRGETERLWMFALAPFCALAASILVPQGTHGTIRALVAAVAVLIVLQAAQTLLMAATLAPLVLPL